MRANGAPEKVTMDKSGANKAAIDEIKPTERCPWWFARSNISIILWNKTIAL